MITKFAEGQVWTYSTRPGESESRITIVRLDDDVEYGNIIHIFISNVAIPNPQAPHGKTTYIAHLPYAEDALDQSVAALERDSAEIPDYEEGYRLWREAFEDGEAGVFTIPVEQAIDVVQETINPNK